MQQGLQLALNRAQVVEQDPAVAELLLQLQRVHVRETQLGGGLAGRPLHDRLERGELGRHAGRGQKHIVFGAVIEPGELPPQGLADLQLVGRRHPPDQVRLSLPRGDDQPRMLPERAQRRRSRLIGHHAMNAPERHHFRVLAAGALDELARTAGRRAARGNGRHGYCPRSAGPVPSPPHG